MLICPNIALDRAWNTWSSRPAEMVFLPLGVRLTPVLYSSAAGSASDIVAGRDIRFLEHATDGRYVRFDTDHGGTELSWAYDKHDPWTVSGGWSAGTQGEWGLRYWVTLCLSGERGETVHWADGADGAGGAAVIRVGRRYVALVADQAPAQVTAHDSIADLAQDFETNGYWNTATRGTEAPVLALRFNLEMMRDCRFAAGVADREDLAVAKARAALTLAPADLPALQTGRNAGALDAIRDVLAWNTVWDGTNNRVYSPVSRIWNLGDYAVWYNDTTYNALMAGLMDPALSRDNMACAMASATPQGNFACILTSNDEWVDRTQAPNGALMAWMAYQRSGDRSLLELAFPALAANQRWWRAHRDPDGRGLVSCGTSDVGEALYKGTHFGARNETGMDNSPTHDEAIYSAETRTLSLLDVGLNCTLALDAEMLALIAAELGHADQAAEFTGLAAASRDRIRAELWDDARGIFANRQRGGGFVRSVGPTSFYPLICGAASADQVDRLMAHLDDPDMFGGDYVIPNVSRNDPAYGDNVYWRGRIWPNVNWFVWQGLRRAGQDDRARDFAARSMAMFRQNWEDRRIVAENYNADTGEAMDQPDTDPFLCWGAMLPLIGVGEVMEISPWGGWQIAVEDDVRLGPVRAPAGEVMLTIEGEAMSLTRGGALVFGTRGFRGRLSDLSVSKTRLAMTLHPGLGDGTLILPDHMAGALAFVDGTPIKVSGTSVPLEGISDGTRLLVSLL